MSPFGEIRTRFIVEWWPPHPRNPQPCWAVVDQQWEGCWGEYPVTGKDMETPRRQAAEHAARLNQGMGQ